MAKFRKEKTAKPTDLEATALQHEQEIKELKTSVRNLTARQKRMTKTLVNIRTDLRKTESRVGRISPHEIEPKLDMLDDRVTHINNAYILLIEKTTVLTEVCFWMRLKNPEDSGKCAEACVWAYDGLDDDWWRARTKKTIEGWYRDIWRAWTDYQAIVEEQKSSQNPFDLSTEQPSKRRQSFI